MIIYGKQLFLHLLNRHPQKFIRIILAKECEKEIFKKIVATGVKIERVDAKKAQGHGFRRRPHGRYGGEVQHDRDLLEGGFFLKMK